MKTSLLTGLAALLFLTVFVAACGNAGQQTTTKPPLSIPQEFYEPPTYQELVEGNFKIPELPRITGPRLHQLMQESKELLIVSADPPYMYDDHHIPGAVNIPAEPVDDVTQEMIEEYLLELPADKQLIFYCS